MPEKIYGKSVLSKIQVFGVYKSTSKCRWTQRTYEEKWDGKRNVKLKEMAVDINMSHGSICTILIDI